MKIDGLHEFIKILEANNELVRIKEFVDPELEISEITDRISKCEKQNKALLFENTGTSFPLLINAYGNEKRVSLALHSENINSVEQEINQVIERFLKPAQSLSQKLGMLSFLSKLSSYFPKVKNKKAACQEVIIRDPDLSKFPVLKCWPHDAGRFITLPVVNTKDPATGVRNAGMYRMQVMGKNVTGMHWHLHKTGARHYHEYLRQNKKIPVAVILGGDPVYAYCASAPLPDGIDEYILAGFIRKKKVSLVKCLTQDIEVPADADIVIEGYVDPSEPMVVEGPFGDHTGFYSLPDNYPLFHITCITHRRNAVYPATIVGIPPQEDYWLIKASERIFLPLLQKASLPEIINMSMPDYGVAHNLVIVQIKNEYPGQVNKVAHALWGMGQMMLNKVLIVTDLDPFDEKALSERFLKTNLLQKIIFSAGPMDALEHATDVFAFGGKLAIDLTNSDDNKFIEFTQEELLIIQNELSQESGIIDYNRTIAGKRILLITNKNGVELNIKNVLNKLFDKKIFFNAVLIFDQGLDILNVRLSLWNALANIDPKRDISNYNREENPCFIVNCKSKPNSKKTWPNPVYSSSKTIEDINLKWEKLGLGDFIPSPSQVIHNMIVTDSFEVVSK